MSFRHSLLFIALTAAVAVPNPNNFIPSHLDVYRSVAASLPMTITLWAGGSTSGSSRNLDVGLHPNYRLIDQDCAAS